MTRVYVFTQLSEGAAWSQRTSYTSHVNYVRDMMHKLLKQDYDQGGKDAMPHRVMLVEVDPERPADTRLHEFRVELIEPRLVRCERDI